MQIRPPLGQIAQAHPRPVSVTASERRLPGPAPVLTAQSGRLPAPRPAAPMEQVAAPPASVATRARRQAQATEPPNAALSALRAQYPFIRQAASAYVDDMLSALGLSPHDKDQLSLVRFTKPSAQQRAAMRAHGRLRIAGAAEIAGRLPLADVLTRGFGQYGRTDMGAARGQFGVYTRAQIERQVPLATGDARALAAYSASQPEAVNRLGEIAPSRIDSGRLYGKLERISESGQGFRQVYEQRLQQYWDRQAEPLAMQQRRIALDMAMAAYAGDALDDRDLELAVHGVGGAALERVKAYALDVAGHRSHNALRIEDAVSGRNLLYLPGSRTPWRGFNDVHAARQWLDQKAADPGWCGRFVQRHFTLLPASEGVSLQAQLAARDQALPLLTADPALSAQPFLGLAQWQRQQDLDQLGAVIDGGDFSAAQQAQRAAWRVLEGAQAAQQKGLAAAAATGGAATQGARQAAAAAAVGLPSVPTLEQKLQEIAWQQPDLRASAAHYATRYLRQHFGVSVPAQEAYLTGFVPRLPDLGRLPPNFGGMRIVDFIPQRLADAAHMPVLPPAQLKRRVALDELFIRNFDQADGNLTNRKGAAAFGVFTEADFGKKNMTVDTWARIDLGTAEAPHDPDLAASRIDATALYRQMTRPAHEGGNDFANVYRQQMADFWSAHRSTLTSLHQQAAMARLDDAMQAGKLDESAHAFFRQGFENRIGGTVQAHPLALAKRVSTNGLRLIEPNGSRNGLYLPGEAEPFRMFANRTALEEWFSQGAKDGAWVERFTQAHFSVNDARGLDGDTGVEAFLKKDFQQGYSASPGTLLYPKALSPTDRIVGDPFGYLSRTKQEKDLEDGRWLVSSNDDYNNEKIVRNVKDIPLAGSLMQLYLGRGAERNEGIGKLVDDVLGVASIVVPETLPARAAEEAAVASGALEQAAAHEASPLERLDYRAAPAVDREVSLKGLHPNSNGVYAVGERQYILLEGHAVRIQGLASQGRRAILADRNGQALHGVQVLRGEDDWQVASLRGGAPIGLGPKKKAPLGAPWNMLPRPPTAGVSLTTTAAASMAPDALYGMPLTAQERRLIWDARAPGNAALATSIDAHAEVKTQKLLADARAHFSSMPEKQASTFELPQGTARNRVIPGVPAAPPLLRSNATDGQILSQVYRQHDGFFIGETHSQDAARRFLVDNMDALQAQNVKTIYLELSDDVVGGEIEKFNRGEPMSSELRDFLGSGLRRGADIRVSDEQLFLAARGHGIAIEPVDSYAAARIQTNDADDRIRAMNYYAWRKITADQAAHPGKWVGLVGQSHLDNTSTQGIASLGQLLNVPSMKVLDMPTNNGGAAAPAGRLFMTDFGDQVIAGNGQIYTRTSDWRLMLPKR